MTRLKDWWAQGRRVAIDGQNFFVNDQGTGPCIVFLHGFPTSSHDWSDVTADLARDHRCVSFDYLGYGASDKPEDADYSSIEQTSRTVALLRHIGVDRAIIVSHDLGGILLQQLLHESSAGALDLIIEHAIFSNSSVYPDLYRPTPAQLALVDPAHGKLLARNINRTALEASLAAMFPEHPPDADRVDDFWAAISTNDGQLLWPEQLVYMAERAQSGGAWVEAMRRTQTPLGFIYGLSDEISGAQILSHAQTDLPSARCIGLPGLGHYPHVEAPAEFIGALREIIRHPVHPL